MALSRCHTAAMMLRGWVGGEPAVLEPLVLEPYEAGWAREALAFVCIHERSEPGGQLRAVLETSPDGLRWTPAAEAAWSTDPGAHRVTVSGFGNWLRATLTSSQRCCADFYWVLK